LKKNKGIVTAAFTPFYQGFTNYLNLGGTGGEEDGLPIFRYEEVDAYFWGFELESSLHFDEFLALGNHFASIDVQLDHVRARNEDDSEDLPRIPPFRTIVRGNHSWNDTIDTMVEAVFVEEQDNVARFELPTESYALLNAQVNVKLPIMEERNLRLFVRGTNLTDDEARIHSSFLKDLAPLRGRALFFGVRGTI